MLISDANSERLETAQRELADTGIDCAAAVCDITDQRSVGMLVEQAAEAFAPEEVAAHRQQADAIREATADLKDEARLLRRVEHLRELVAWGETWLRSVRETDPPVCSPPQHEALETALKLAHKILKDREPGVGDKLLSLKDPDARRNKHGAYYDGYLLDVSLDADSELICGIDALPSNADEAANAKNLIEDEEAA